MAITAQTVNAKVEAAMAALEGGAYGAALDQLLAAEVAVSALPDGTLEGNQLIWGRASIRNSIADVRKRKAEHVLSPPGSGGSGAGLRTTKTRYVRSG